MSLFCRERQSEQDTQPNSSITQPLDTESLVIMSRKFSSTEARLAVRQSYDHDLYVIDSSPVSQPAAIQAARLGKCVAVREME